MNSSAVSTRPSCTPIVASGAKPASSGRRLTLRSARGARAAILHDDANQRRERRMPVVRKTDLAIQVLADEQRRNGDVARDVHECRPDVKRSERGKQQSDRCGHEEQPCPEPGEAPRVIGEIGRKLAPSLETRERSDAWLTARSERHREEHAERDVQRRRWQVQQQRRRVMPSERHSKRDDQPDGAQARLTRCNEHHRCDDQRDDRSDPRHPFRPPAERSAVRQHRPRESCGGRDCRRWSGNSRR